MVQNFLTRIGFLLVAFCVLACQDVLGQTYQIQGVILDSATSQPLPFANLRIEGSKTGTSTDLDGRFSLNTDQTSPTLLFSYVGYRFKKVKVSNPNTLLRVRLAAQNISTQEVTIIAGENPAHRIIKRAVARKDKNNPQNLPSYIYKSHNKFYITFAEKELNTPLPPDSAGTQSEKARKSIDSLSQAIHLFFSESITQKQFLQPDNSNETVLATRTAGFPQLAVVQVATDFQPFGFYQDWVTVFNFQFLNPLSDNSWNRYDFTLEEEIPDGTDTAYIISYRPRPGKNFNGLEGVMRIHSSTYALENIIATQADSGSMLKFHIQQQYRRVDGKTWFPWQFTTDIRHKTLQITGVPIIALARTVLDSVVLDTKLRPRNFRTEEQIIPMSAIGRDSVFWAANRIDSLRVKEYRTMFFYDTLIENNAKGARNFLTAMEYLSTGLYPVGPADIVLKRFFGLNLFEGFRIGAGLQTNDKFSRWFRVGGYWAYGFKDDAFKWGTDVSVLLSDRTQTRFFGRAWHDIREPGTTHYPQEGVNLLSTEPFRQFLMDRADYSTGYSAGIHGYWLKNLFTELSLSTQRLDLTYPYQFVPDQDKAYTGYTITELGISSRYAFGEKHTLFKGRRLQTGSGFPEIRFQLAKGFNGLLDGQFDYNRLDFRLDHKHHWVELGTTRIGFHVGAVVGNAPYGVLFNARGSLNKTYPVVIDNTFQTMGLYEFLNDSYTSLFLSHDLGHIKLKTRYSRPGLIVYQNVGLGTLSRPSAHQGIAYKTMEKGFLESGAVVTDILRVEYVNTFYYGLGAGAFYRYGPYGLPNTKDNLVYKLMLTISF